MFIHWFKCIIIIYIYMCVLIIYMYVCVSVLSTKRREGGREGERERESELKSQKPTSPHEGMKSRQERKLQWLVTELPALLTAFPQWSLWFAQGHGGTGNPTNLRCLKSLGMGCTTVCRVLRDCHVTWHGENIWDHMSSCVMICHMASRLFSAFSSQDGWSRWATGENAR